MKSNPRLMSNLSRHTLLPLLVGILAGCNPPASSNNTVASVASPEPARALVMVAPESVGMDSQRLNRITEAMQDLVDQGLLAGAVTMAARDNKVMHFESVGYRDIDVSNCNIVPGRKSSEPSFIGNINSKSGANSKPHNRESKKACTSLRLDD